MTAEGAAAHPNLVLIERFFTAYLGRDISGMARMTTPDVHWRFPGPPPLGGVWRGVEGIVVFLDRVSTLGLQETTYVRGANDRYVVECKETHGPRDGPGMLWCVLWSFRDGRISAGVHFSADAARLAELASATSAGIQPVAGE